MPIKEGSNNDMVMRNEIIITDWDGVLQMIDKAWCYMVKTQEELLSPWFDFNILNKYGSKQFVLDVLNRDKYYLNDWLKRKDVDKLPDEVYELFMGLYTHNDYFYEGCDWMSMMDALAGMSKQNFVKEIIILTHVPFENSRDLRKEKIFAEKIKPISGKFTLVQLHTSKSKADWIKENKPNFTVFIDDRAEIIREVVEKNSVFEKMIYMPLYGYNQDIVEDDEFLKKLDARGCTLSVYPCQIIPGKDKLVADKTEHEKLLEKLNEYMNERTKDDKGF